MSNHLAHETSPYLLQHASNPVDWYPWGDVALQKAAREDKPIFLSIGYSACHWCHVMAHESFEDDGVAEILNRHFVSIKVDREERPDLDRIYMAAVQALTGNGGWPMSVFLTPQGEPFFGGTYFPPTPRHGMTSFGQVLQAIVDAWETRRPEIEESGRKLVAQIQLQANATGSAGSPDMPGEQMLRAAVQSISSGFDWVHGGWGTRQKFPQPMVVEFLLRRHHATGDPDALEMVIKTLDAMARGGMYDQLGGGFHRYSVDASWLVPHFEKMLYDNAQLARVYLHAWQVTLDPLYRAIVEETLDYVVREMTHPGGGFLSSQDADSEGEEGKYFLWTMPEIEALLGDRAEPFCSAYPVAREGNFEGSTILTFTGTMEQRERLASSRHGLFESREVRIHPGFDDKVLTSWNGLMLAAFSEAAQVLDRPDYLAIAEANAAFLLCELRTDEGRLLHSWRSGEAKLNGYLEDYAYLIEGLIELYEASFEPRWLLAALELADTMADRFSAPDGGFYDTSDDHETLITRPREVQDNATPSGSAMAAYVLLRLASLGAREDLARIAGESFGLVQSHLARYPTGFGQWLVALDYASSAHQEVVIAGDLASADTRALVAVARDGFFPHRLIVVGDDDGQATVLPVLEGRPRVDGRAAAYVCSGFVCHAQVTEPAALAKVLSDGVAN